MRFHAKENSEYAFDLPVALGHFVPWYTLRTDGFCLPSRWVRTLDGLPEIAAWRHWRDRRAGYRRTHLHLPAVGCYDSRDPDVIEWQIRSALEHGIEGFIINWYGKYSVENVITLHWLDGLTCWNREHPDQPFTYFLSLDSQARLATEGKRPLPLREDLEYIHDHLMNDYWLCRDGRPIFSVFPYENDAPLWVTELDAVFGDNGFDLIWMNDGPCCGESAAYPWIRPDDVCLNQDPTHTWSDPDNAGTDWLSSFYREMNAREGLTYLMGGVWPGFDDQLVSWAWNPQVNPAAIRPRVMCRETVAGNTLELTCRTNLDYIRRWAAGNDASARLPMPLIQVVTWNDYAEASTVEPTRDYGNTPLKTIRTTMHEAHHAWERRL